MVYHWHLAQWWEARGSAAGTISPGGCGQDGKSLMNRNRDNEGLREDRPWEDSLLGKAEGDGCLLWGAEKQSSKCFAEVFRCVRSS